jgi:hypothetical protein
MLHEVMHHKFILSILVESTHSSLKGKCALGPFLSILVIKCPTQIVMC